MFSSCDEPLGQSRSGAEHERMVLLEKSDMETSLTNLEICIALIIAINVAVLALRLCVSLYKA